MSDFPKQTDTYKPTIFITDTLPLPTSSSKESLENRSVRFSSIETAQPVNRSSLLAGVHAPEHHTVQRIPKLAQHRRAEGFSTVAMQRPKSALAVSSNRRPIAESTDLSVIPDGGHYSPSRSGSTSESKVSLIACANQPSQTSRSENTVLGSSFSNTSNKVPHRTTSTRRNPMLDKSVSQHEYTAKLLAEQEIPASQFQIIRLLHAEYILLLLRNERLQKYHTFCALSHNLLNRTLKNKTASTRANVLKNAYANLITSINAARAALQDISKRVLVAATPSVLKQLSALNNAVELCTATRLKGLSLVPTNECTERLSEMIRAIDRFLEHVSPIETDITMNSTKNVDASLVSNICRSTARLQALVYETAVLGHRKRHD